LSDQRHDLSLFASNARFCFTLGHKLKAPLVGGEKGGAKLVVDFEQFTGSDGTTEKSRLFAEDDKMIVRFGA
jgi:hypothetical protein